MQTIELSAGTIEYEDTGGGPRSRMARESAASDASLSIGVDAGLIEASWSGDRHLLHEDRPR